MICLALSVTAAMFCSGPGQVMELELKVDSSSMKQLLQFLTGGFNGGTDVDKPLELSLKRLGEKEWNQVGPTAAAQLLCLMQSGTVLWNCVGGLS